jgi:HEAT repeat protein
MLLRAEAQKPMTRIVWLQNNYGRDYRVASVSSKKGLIEVLSHQRVNGRYKFELQITPPAAEDKKGRFRDTLFVTLQSGERLSLECNGFYSRSSKAHRDSETDIEGPGKKIAIAGERISETPWHKAVKQALETALKQVPQKRTRPEWLTGVESKEDLQRVISENLRDLGDPNLAVVLRARGRLEYLGAEAFDALVQVLRSENSSVRQWSAQLLRSRGEPAVQHLCKALRNDPYFAVRHDAARSLGWTFSPRAVPALIEALQDEHLQVRRSALLALTYLRDKRAVEPVIAAIESDTSGELSELSTVALLRTDFDAARKILLRIAEKEADRNLRSFYLRKAQSESPPQYPYWPPHLLHIHQLTKDVQTLAGEQFGEQEIQQLLAHIDSPDARVSGHCISALGQMRAVSAIPEIIELLERKPLWFGYGSLAKMATPEAVRYIAKAVRSEDLKTRKAAVGGLGESAGRWAMPLLIRLLDDADLRTPALREGIIDGMAGGYHGYWPAQHMAHTSLVKCFGRVGLDAEAKNLATGAQFNVDEEVTGLKKWWQRHGQAFLEGKPVPKPKISRVFVMTGGGGLRAIEL